MTRVVPIMPAPEAALRARYPAALAHVYDADLVAAGRVKRPGDRPAHVFDTLDGVRLIVSRERVDREVWIHVSASFHEKCPPALVQLRKVLSLDDVLDFLLRRFREISGEHGEARFLGLSEGKGVPHWIVKPTELQ